MRALSGDAMAARKRTLRKRKRAPAAKGKARTKRVPREGAKPKRSLAKVRKRATPRPASSANAVQATPPSPASAEAETRNAVKRVAGRSADRFAASIALLESEPERAGIVLHVFRGAGAALVALEAPLALGDRVHIRGATTDFVAEVTSLRSGGASVSSAAAGEATLALPERVRVRDVVYVLRAQK